VPVSQYSSLEIEGNVQAVYLNFSYDDEKEWAIAKEGYCSSVTKKKIIIACILNTRRRGIKLLHFL
jgi:hypothetical protein